MVGGKGGMQEYLLPSGAVYLSYITGQSSFTVI